MPIKCYTCNQLIEFDSSVLSKTGKKIPLTPDKKFKHGHDKDGNPVNTPLDEQQQIQQQPPKFVPESRNAPIGVSIGSSAGFTSTGQSQGGSYMDTKRLRVMVEEEQKLLNLIDEKIEACYQLAKSNNNMLGELIQFFKINDPKSAAELYSAMNNTKQEALKPDGKSWQSWHNNEDPKSTTTAEVKGWNSVPHNEQKDFPVEKTLKEDEDDDADLEKEGL